MVFLTLWIPPVLPGITRAIRERKIGIFKLKERDLRLLFPFVLLIIWFIFWISSFSMWGWTIQSIYQTIISENAPSQLGDLADQISYAQGYGYSVIEQVIRRLWGPIILSILSVITLPLLWKNFTHERQEECLFSFYGPLGMLALVMSALYLFNLAFGPLRLMFYVSMLETVFAAYLLAYLLTGGRKNIGFQGSNLRVASVILVIVGLFMGGMLNLYPSPYNLVQSYHNPKSEVAGMAYIYEHRDVDVPLSGITVAPGRFAHALLTPEERVVQRLPMYFENQVAPWHFGYDNYSTISSVYHEETDLAIKPADKIIYVDYFPDMAQYRFSTQDFERLENDPGVALLYTNGEFDHWRVTVVT